MKRSKPELLAPANVNTLSAAVCAGADAVYLGASEFGARKNAMNFNAEALEKAVDYCHLRGVKVHLTLNTLVGDREMEQFVSTASDAAKAGVDAFIVQDIGALQVIKQTIRGVELHASTQMTIHNFGGVKFAESLGFDRVVLSRELTLEEIENISKHAIVETEVFVHGALCFCYSGQCLMSSMIGARSGNRGMCAQPCRLPYKFERNGEGLRKGYLLSPRDLCLAEYLPRLEKAGVNSLKIEGRMKGKEYVEAAVGIYRRCIDECRGPSEKEIYLLENSFSRGGFTTGFFGGEKTSDIINSASNHDDIYVKRDENALKQLAEFKKEIKRPVKISVEIKKNEPIRAVLRFGSCEIKAEGETAEAAENRPTDAETVKRQMEKTGGTPFYSEKTEVYIQENLFVSVGALNELRRNLLYALEKYITVNKAEIKPFVPLKTEKKTESMKLTVSVKSKNQLEAIDLKPFKYIFVPWNLYEEAEHNEKFVYVLPDIIRDEKFFFKIAEKMKNSGVRAVICGNYSLIDKAIETGLDVYGSQGLNIFNSQAAEFWRKRGLCGAFVSEELNLNEIKGLSTSLKIFVNVYGRTTLMKTEHSMGCGTLTDRKNEKFPVIENEITEILNSKPVYMADKLDAVKKTGVFGGNLNFTVESPKVCREITEMYLKNSPPVFPFTRGHFGRGVVR